MNDKPALQSMTVQGLLITVLALVLSKLKINADIDQVTQYVSWALAGVGTALTFIGRQRLTDKLVAYKSLTLQGLVGLLIIFLAGKFKLALTEAEGAEYATYAVSAIAFIWGLIGRLRRGGISGVVLASTQG